MAGAGGGGAHPAHKKLSRWNTFCVVQPYSGTLSWMRASCTWRGGCLGLVHERGRCASPSTHQRHKGYNSVGACQAVVDVLLDDTAVLLSTPTRTHCYSSATSGPLRSSLTPEPGAAARQSARRRERAQTGRGWPGSRGAARAWLTAGRRSDARPLEKLAAGPAAAAQGSLRALRLLQIIGS